MLDELVLELFGTPDPLQVDGLGGSHSHTSKFMVVEPSDRDDVDIEYMFGQVGIEKPMVDWSGNCGNLTSAVGMFAIKEGIVESTGSSATLGLYNTNTDTIIEQEIPLTANDPEIYGEYSIDGVPGTGARIDSTFLDPAGGVFKSMIPTGDVVDAISFDGETLETSLIDVTNPCVFVRAEHLGLSGTELPSELTDDPGCLDKLERIRGIMYQQTRLVNSAIEAKTESPTTPFIAIIAPPRSYETSEDTMISVMR